ncbi:hypothetical protein RM780_12125 [Streptomyces sp. DSM 44917]|uniref:ARB-07466-like C-terminal domain-containing protein n=1 Tax=Streptomyces boetiae TaxID=3075541 RepID=A0ABU2L807_9ACTN|nr:hypothetical protein [Streptomyces sp. DSM 44917]MDT0307705.1 hypothetical protein [Streptomyces sp. DSM 44917]
MPEPTTPTTPTPTNDRRPRRALRRALATFVVLATLAMLGAGAWFVMQVLRFLPEERPDPPRCAVAARDGGEAAYTLQPQQAANAATIEAVASARGLPERAVTIALATAIQESTLRNLGYGDRDSLGLFQQRPSMGWGTAEQVTDPVYAAGAFYDGLVEVPRWETMPLTEAAQAVQRSAYPDEYAGHEEEAALLAAALTGRAGATLTCSWDEEAAPVADPAPEGDAGTVEAELARQFGADVGAVTDGEFLSVPLEEADAARTARGWELAHWAMAHAAELGIERITLGDRLWEAERSQEGWQRMSEENVASSEPGLRLSVFPAAS